MAFWRPLVVLQSGGVARRVAETRSIVLRSVVIDFMVYEEWR
jgi:hypothetical protein